MKKDNLSGKSKKELEKILNDKREELRKFSFNLAAGKLKNVREIRQIKKEIARILTSFSLKPKTDN